MSTPRTSTASVIAAARELCTAHLILVGGGEDEASEDDRFRAGSAADELREALRTLDAATAGNLTTAVAFRNYWRNLLARSAVLRLYRRSDELQGMAFGDFRAALRDAFTAGRDTLL